MHYSCVALQIYIRKRPNTNILCRFLGLLELWIRLDHAVQNALHCQFLYQFYVALLLCCAVFYRATFIRLCCAVL